MKLKVVGSGSAGNTYILENEDEALILDCGCKFNKVKEAIDFNIRKIKGCVVTHQHLDHAEFANHYWNCGIPVLAAYREKPTKARYGNFVINAFPLVHDVPCCGYHIYHPDMGYLIYATDTEYIKWKFSGINHFLVEANYGKQLIRNNAKRNHVLQGHMSIETTCDFIAQSQKSCKDIRNVIMCHLSEENSDTKLFTDMMQKVTDSTIYVAENGMVIDVSRVPF